MKTKFVLWLFALMSNIPLAVAQDLAAVAKNEADTLRFAEQILITEMVQGLSSSFRKEKEICLKTCSTCSTCPEVSATELVIALISINRSNAASNTLVNLLALRLDGADSEELDCQIAIRGRTILSHLKRLQTKSVVDRCYSTFHELKKRELAHVTDVKAEQICRSEAEVLRERNEMLEMIKSGAECPW